VVQNANPYDHLRSIHNAGTFYDHAKPWVSHLRIQRSSFAKAQAYRNQYRKLVVFDECRYEGNVRQGWGNISAARMTYNFWAGRFRAVSSATAKPTSIPTIFSRDPRGVFCTVKARRASPS